MASLRTNGLGSYFPQPFLVSLLIDQRFITPIFIHAGVIHIILNMLAQVIVSAQVCDFHGYLLLLLTKDRSKRRWVPLAFSSFILLPVSLGMCTELFIFQPIESSDRNVLGGNFALLGLPSVGASGAIFGTVAATWVDLLTHWRYKYQPGRQVRPYLEMNETYV